MRKHTSRSLLALVLSIVIGCSFLDSIKNSSPALSELPADSLGQGVHAGLEPDSVVVVVELDTALTVQEEITQKMEEARIHYRSALAAQAVGDSTISSKEFERAIEILNALSYYPEAEENEEFSDLTQSVIEDYERYIASIDELSPESSVFALREQLNLVVESIDVSGIKIPKRIFKGMQVPFVVNRHVERNVVFYLTKGSEHFELWMYLAGKYFPHMKRIFKEEEVPEEIVYLSMMESGLNPSARSWMRAVGLWQFMRGTGRLYGLSGNWWYDERRDFEKSTRAAARHLNDLYERFDDWYLAIAAYNSGPGRIARAIRRSGSRDFWKMRRYLPRQTRNFVPQFLAVAMMAMSPEEFGFQGITPAPVLEFDVVTIDDCVDLTVLAKAAETNVETMHELNPELLRWCTPPGYEDYVLRIPRGKAEIFASNYAQIPDDKKRDWVVHKVRRGETLGGISKRYRVSMGLLVETNNIRNKHRISTGQVIMIPVPSGTVQYAARSSKAQPESLPKKRRRPVKWSAVKQVSFPGKVKLTYRIRRGDTIGHIAEWYDTRASQIRMWNEIPYGSFIRENEQLVIWVPESKRSQYEQLNELSFEEKEHLEGRKVVDQRQKLSKSRPGHWLDYKVRWGDTLGEIATRFGSTVEDLKSWNGLRSNRIKVGQILLVDVGEKDSNNEHSTNERESAERGFIVHKVRKGESLSKIAQFYDVSTQEIKNWNNLESSRIYAGQELRIYDMTKHPGSF